MKPSILGYFHRFGFSVLFSLMGILATQKVSAQAGEFVCGNLIESTALAKAADLPKTTKVWSGKLKALIFRISFTDGAYSIDTSTINRTNTSINALFRSMSRNTFQWEFSIYPTILPAPGDQATYAANFTNLQSWITSQITAAGLKRGIDYDVYIASFPNLTLGWAGLSNMRDADWINGNYSSAVTAHELGHSMGLPHAHSIEAGTDMFGTPGSTSQTNEYGNPYDVMGHGGSTAHFNVLYKLRVGWEDADEIKEVKTSGVYRIYAQDNAVHKGRLIGIRLPSANPNFGYWFEYRTLSPSARLGASVLFQGFKSATNLDSWYLDTTPNSKTSNDENDGVLVSGKEFKDKYGEVTFKTLAINTNVWNEEGWVDLQVTIPSSTAIVPKAHPPSALTQQSGTDFFFNLQGKVVSPTCFKLPTLKVIQTEQGKATLSLLVH